MGLFWTYKYFMLYKFKCLVQPKLDSQIFSYFDQAIGRRRILDKWFFFYINEPIKPIIVWKTKNNSNYQLQPGTNRYIGVALRGNKEWLSGHYITDKLEDIPGEIKILNAIDSADFADEHLTFNNITLDNPVHKWGIGDQTLYDAGWIQPVYDWIHDNLKYVWGLEYNGKTYYVNSERRFFSFFKKTKLIVNANDYPTLRQAVKHLFEQIKLVEFNDGQLS